MSTRMTINGVSTCTKAGTEKYEKFQTGIGFHDASWRSKFGGTIYQYSGSHGCINLPVDKAKLLYEKVYKGMPVLCHN